MWRVQKERMVNAGLSAFIWSDSGDVRVCEDCAQRNGKLFFFKDNPLFPGERDGCRCVAEAVDEDEIDDHK